MPYKNEMNGSEFIKNVLCHKILLSFQQNAPEIIEFMKKAYKDNFFGESTIFCWHNDFKKGCLSAELAPKPG